MDFLNTAEARPDFTTVDYRDTLDLYRQSLSLNLYESEFQVTMDELDDLSMVSYNHFPRFVCLISQITRKQPDYINLKYRLASTLRILHPISCQLQDHSPLASITWNWMINHPTTNNPQDFSIYHVNSAKPSLTTHTSPKKSSFLNGMKHTCTSTGRTY